MKLILNISKTLLLPALLLATLPALAGGNGNLPDVSIEKLQHGQKVSIELNNLKSEAVIRLTNESGETLSKATVEPANGRAVKIFNLEKVNPGRYRFVVSTSSKETLQPFEVMADDILIDEDKRQVYFVPTIRIGDDYVDVSWLNGKISDLTFEIQTSEGARVFEDELTNILKVERRYNLSQLERGEYMLVVSTPYKTHYERLSID
jgi:hypothetical protein